MSTRQIISEYFKSHNRATFTQIRLYCQSVGCDGGNVAFAINDMLKRNELTRTGEKGSYQYLPSGELKEAIKLGRPACASTQKRQPFTPSVALLDKLLRSVRNGATN